MVTQKKNFAGEAIAFLLYVMFWSALGITASLYIRDRVVPEAIAAREAREAQEATYSKAGESRDWAKYREQQEYNQKRQKEEDYNNYVAGKKWLKEYNYQQSKND